MAPPESLPTKPVARPRTKATRVTKPAVRAAAPTANASQAFKNLFACKAETPVVRERCEKITWGRDGYPKRCEKLVVVRDPALKRVLCAPHLPAQLSKAKFRATWNGGKAPSNPAFTPVAKMLAARYTPTVRARRCEGMPHRMLLSVEGTPLESLLYDNKRALVYAVQVDGGSGTRDLTWDELLLCKDVGIDTIFPFDWAAIRPEGAELDA